MSDPSWAAHELASADLGDIRLNKRLFALVEALLAQPEASLPQACEQWAAAKAAYRFLSNPRVTPQAVRDAQHAAVIARARLERVVLLIQDSTQLDFSSQASLRGLGPLHGATQRGLHVHSGLVVSTCGLPLGIAWQQVWARDAKKRGQSQERKQRAQEDKESQKWLDGLTATAKALPNTVHYITIADREGDMYPLLAHERPANSDYVVRAAYNRCIGEEAHTLEAALAQAPVLGRVTLEVARRAGEEARQATLTLWAVSVTLQPSAQTKADYKPVRVQAVLSQEDTPPAGATPLRWLLLTTLPIATLEDAQQCVRYYAYRWLIERYHFVLKSGCRLERLQLETAARVQVALALYSVVAWRLLWLTHAARQHPERSSEALLQAHEWQALCCTMHKTSVPPEHAPSLRQAVRWIAQLGGFLARKGDGEPGVQTLWRGLRRLHDIAATWQLLYPPRCG